MVVNIFLIWTFITCYFQYHARCESVFNIEIKWCIKLILERFKYKDNRDNSDGYNNRSIVLIGKKVILVLKWALVYVA